ncbi:MAG: hypothetical protein KC940_10625 [Candidatus Omnitrophica bacterium]|nr:hypothetical protein [Candidatus Omnitrophota bacterium]MCA9430950.1 hypothetical protein [Candidatus Omnitrophota bacterium]MCA9435795.1 hypothetical protein [Candidatus Omnitrophota bacterium]
MSDRNRFRIQSTLIFGLCLLLSADIFLRVFDGDRAEATRISGRETDAAIDRLAGTYYQMSAANTALASSINRLTAQLARLELEKWADAEEQLADSQELLAEAATNLAMSIAPPEPATDSGETPPTEDASGAEEPGEKGPAIKIDVEK